MTTSEFSSSTVGELVRERPARSKVFEAFKIDFCCGGKIPLAEACAKRGIDPDQVIEALQAAEATPAAIDPDQLSLTALVDHIENTHHAYLREELPRLDFMTKKVAAVHGEKAPELIEIRDVFVDFQAEINSHMMKEESILFPIIRDLDTGKASSHCESIANPINQMEHEHDSAGDALSKFRSLTSGYTPPEGACNTYRALFQALADLEEDLHIHVHKENNVLFPKALAREESLV